MSESLMIGDWEVCFFCGLDACIDDNPAWDAKSALKAIEDKYPSIKEGGAFWCCVACERFLNVSDPI